MGKMIAVAVLLAVVSIIAAFAFLPLQHDSADVIAPGGLDLSSDRYSPPEQYAAAGDGLLREQYADLATALRQPRGSAQRGAWVGGTDLATTEVDDFLATTPVPAGGVTGRDDIITALTAWRAVRHDASTALKYCVIRGHVEPGFGPRAKSEFFFDAFYCTKASGFIQKRLTSALAHVDSYLSALRKLSDDSGLGVSHGPDPSWDLANVRSLWIYGKPRQTAEYAGTYI